MRKAALLAVCCSLITIGGCKAMENKDSSKIYAVIDTAKGSIKVELFYNETPLTVTNFVGLAEGTLDAAKGKPFYDGLKFHRVISKTNGDDQDFMIQGGDPQGNGTGGPGYKFADEIVSSLTFDKPGLLAMANSGAGTNGSQFFITIVPTPWLDGRHTIFGQVTEGMNVVNAITQDDVIQKITIVRDATGNASKFSATQKDFAAAQTAQKQAAAEMEKGKVGSADIAKNFLKGKVDKTPEGILYVVTKKGNGDKIGKGKQVSVEYTGYFLDHSVFDTSAGRGPLEFQTGAGQMIPGFDKIVQDMALGEKRSIVLPPAEAYGSNGAGGIIPPNAYLSFDIELIQVQ